MKPTKEYTGRSTIRMYNADCMDLMNTGKEWDLAIVDPPYGLGDKLKPRGGMIGDSFDGMGAGTWDDCIPKKHYFTELQTISENQIIWGGNYFIDNLNPTSCFLVWDKMNGTNPMADAELAWTSFDKSVRTFRWHHFSGKRTKKIHPTQKPVKLYKWLLANYANEGDTILDTHGGSMSIAIACWDLGFDLDICELDTNYFNDAVKRFEQHISQTQLF